MKIFSFLAILVFSSVAVMGQYGSPVDFPIYLSGNVGEIRSTHFHSGIDIKSPVGIGAPVRSIADGYVERVFVSPAGYGKAVYVRHLDGSVSVYGHLDKFEKAIGAWVKQQQMDKQSFRVDAYPPRTMFAVKQGEVIGYLGNSGSSGGPHLHLEIRNSAGEPLNIQARKFFTIKDDIAPKLYKIIIMECDTVNGAPIFTASNSIEFKDGVPVNGKTFTASKPFYIAYDLIDFASGSNNTLGIYSLTQSVNGKQNFGFTIDKTSYVNGKYVNTLLEWNVAPKGRSTVVRAYTSPNNALKIYDGVRNRGILAVPSSGQPLQVALALVDNNGNATKVDFAIEQGERQAAPVVEGHTVAWDRDFTTSGNNFKFSIPSKALYETAIINIASDGTVVEVGRSNIALQKSFTLAIGCPLELQGLQSKAIIVNDKGRSVGGVYKNGYVEAKIGAFGKYRVSHDNTPPVIVYNGIKNGFLSFKATDDLSGIKSYNLTIDGQWAIGDYDAKTGNITCDIDYGTTSNNHALVLTVTDNKGNSGSIKTTAQW